MRLLDCKTISDCYAEFGSSVYFFGVVQGDYFKTIYAEKVGLWRKIIDDIIAGGLSDANIPRIVRKHFPKAFKRELDLFIFYHGEIW